MTPEPPITAVIVTYNSADTIGAALAALAEGHTDGFVRAIVVDNASTDGTAAIVTEQFPWVDLVAGTENLGFGRGCNVGLSMAGGECVLFLNPDAVLPLPALRTLYDHLATHHQAAIAAPAILAPDGSAQTIHPLPSPWRIIAAAAGRERAQRIAVNPGDPPRRTSWLCGAVLLARRELLTELGGFDPRFFLYFEETDLCRRVVEAGGELWALGEAVATHQCGASTAKATDDKRGNDISSHYYESRFYYLRKHFGVIPAMLGECGELVTLGLQMLGKRLLGRSDNRFRERLRAPILKSPRAAPPRTRE